METGATSDYPVSLDIDFPEGPRNRLTTAFRLFLVIPIWIILVLLGTSEFSHGSSRWFAGGGAGFVFLPLLLMILFRQKYPKWWFDWNLELAKFGTRTFSYFALLRDEYPSTDEEQAVHLDIIYPDAKQDLNRWLPLVKWFLAIPHYIVLVFLSIVGLIMMILAWFSILITGRFSRDWFNLIVGIYRWYLRVIAYAFLLTTDQYPPFRLGE